MAKPIPIELEDNSPSSKVKNKPGPKSKTQKNESEKPRYVKPPVIYTDGQELINCCKTFFVTKEAYNLHISNDHLPKVENADMISSKSSTSPPMTLLQKVSKMPELVSSST